MMAERKQTSDSGGNKELDAEEWGQEDAKFKQMQGDILEIVSSVISKLEHTHDKSREVHLSKMKSLHAVLTNNKKNQSREQHILPKSRTENSSQNSKAGGSSSSKPSSTNDEASRNNKWLPSHKNSTALKYMLALDSLRNLYKCMDEKCIWTDNDACSFLYHLRSEHFNKKESDWNHCSYCPFQGDGTPEDLVQHITRKHGHCQYQCAYCFFRGMACSYVVLHQNMFHINKLVRVLQCPDVKVSPPAESELEPLASVVQPYICDQGSCGKIFYNPKDFLLHLQRQHNQVSTLTCHICKATWLKAASLVFHYKFHSLSLYQCRHCLHGAEKEEEIHKHLCNMHPNLPAVTVLRHYEPTKLCVPDADVNQLKIVNLDQSQMGDVISRPSESTPIAGGVMTSIQSKCCAEEGTEDTADTKKAAHILFNQMTERDISDAVQNASLGKVIELGQKCALPLISKNYSSPIIDLLPVLKTSSSLQETDIKGDFSDSSPSMEQNVEKSDDNNDSGVYEDDDLEVLYCQLAMKDKQCYHVTCKGVCKLRESQTGKESPVQDLKNSVSELLKETDSQNSSDSVMLLAESYPEATGKEENEFTQEHKTKEEFSVSTPKKFSTQIPILNVESESNSASEPERNSCAEPVNSIYSVHKPQTSRVPEGSAVTKDSVTLGDKRKQFTASGLMGEDLYLCGNTHCEYRATTKSQLRKHLYVCGLSSKGVLQCRHCSQSFKALDSFLSHLSIHGVPRYSCALCMYCVTDQSAVEKHLELQHNVSCTETVPVDNFLNNHDSDMFIVFPKEKEKSQHNQTGHVIKSVYKPEEIHILPVGAILKDPIECSECSFKTKVCSHMKQHLDPDVDPADIPTIEVVNYGTCLQRNEKMLHKMTNLAASSNTNVPKLSSSGISSNSGSMVTAGTTCGPSKSGKKVQKANLHLTSQLTKRATAPRAKKSIRDLTGPLPSASQGKEVRNAACSTKSQSTKRGAARQTRTPICDLPEPVDAAAGIIFQPTMRAAAIRAIASIRDLSESLPSASKGKELKNAASTSKSQSTKRAVARKARTSICDLSEPEDDVAAIIFKPTKRAAAVRARESIRDLSEIVPFDLPEMEAEDADFAAIYQPIKRAAALRAMASIRDLSESVPSDSPTPSLKGSDIEEPGLEMKQTFVSSPKNKKKPTSREPKLPCLVCGRKCIDACGLKTHMRENHRRTAKWLCGYCRQGGPTEMAIKQHCRVRHGAMPELVKYNEGATSVTPDDVRHRSMPELVKYNEEAASLKLDNEFWETNYGLPQKTKTTASSPSSAQHPEPLLGESDRQTKFTEFLTAKEAHHCKQKSFDSTLLKHREESHRNKEFSITEAAPHHFECCMCNFVAVALHVLRKHFEMEHHDCEFRYIVKPTKSPRDASDSVTVRRETFAVKPYSMISTLCDAGNYVCLLCNAKTDSEERFHNDHHSVHHPNVEPKYCFETVGHEAKHTKFECQKCCFTSDNFEILKEHLLHHIKAFQMWLSAQQCDLQGKVVGQKFSHVDCNVRESEMENRKKCVTQRNMEGDESLCSAVQVSEKKDMQCITYRIQNVANKSTDSSSVSARLLMKSSANRSEGNSTKSSDSHDPNTERHTDENKLLVFVNYGGSRIRMSVSTFSKLYNIYPKVKVRDLKHEKLAPV